VPLTTAGPPYETNTETGARLRSLKVALFVVSGFVWMLEYQQVCPTVN
jgi:hypothetical protein